MAKVNIGKFVEAPKDALEDTSEGGNAAANTIVNSVMNIVTTVYEASMSLEDTFYCRPVERVSLVSSSGITFKQLGCDALQNDNVQIR